MEKKGKKKREMNEEDDGKYGGKWKQCKKKWTQTQDMGMAERRVRKESANIWRK